MRERFWNGVFLNGKKCYFSPNQHLGRNTGYSMDIPLEEMVTWDLLKSQGGLTEDQIRNAAKILWKGYCSVHQVFKPEHIDNFLVSAIPKPKLFRIRKLALKSARNPITSVPPNTF